MCWNYPENSGHLPAEKPFLNIPEPQTDHLPGELATLVSQGWARMQEQGVPEVACALPADFARELATVWSGSDFVLETCLQQPAVWTDLLDSGDLLRSYDDAVYAQRLQAQPAADTTALHHQLRTVRRREMLRIIWRDLARHATLEQTVRDMSLLADACIQHADAITYRLTEAQFGTPCDRQGVPQRLVVLALGKLGAMELNVSSDVDLMFLFPANGMTHEGDRQLDNQQFFIRQGQALIAALHQVDADGFVFRVDMRLRPYGDSGPMAMNFDAVEEYYEDQGREWERYALIKARAVTGGRDEIEDLMRRLRPFVYRRYIDYSVFASLRDMKRLINQEVRRKGLQEDVKLGRGGIREVEFIVQAFQLIRGGRDRRYQDARLLPMLELLSAEGDLDPETGEALQEAYRFLRNTEHAIQAIADRQTQALPRDHLSRLRVAFTRGYQEVAPFLAELKRVRNVVHSCFAELIEPNKEEAKEAGEGLALEEWRAVWNHTLGTGELRKLLAGHGCQDPSRFVELLEGFRKSDRVQRMQAVGRERLDTFLPVLMDEILQQSGQIDAAEALQRILPLLNAVLRRTAYLVLLQENPGARRQLVRLCAASPWIAAELADTPALLDELLDAEALYSPPEVQALREDLRQQLLRVPEEDEEQQLECLRYFKESHVLRVAASEVVGTLPLMKVSDYLTWIAEVILDAVLRMAWRYMVNRHGAPAPGGERAAEFAIVAYGKLGGIELGYGSDLDLVFVYDTAAGGASSGDREGRRSIENSVWFTRLAQRILHLLSIRTHAGPLYEIDVRLRPSGASGLLVASLSGFRSYQQEDAWTWEHQALVRARCVAGDAALCRDIEAVRREILARERDAGQLLVEVRGMREKMRQTLGSKSPGGTEMDLKHDAGGIVDIEFMVQYGVLAWARDNPVLLEWSDNIRIIESLAASGLMDAGDAGRLIEAYKAYRSETHRQALQQCAVRVDAEPFSACRADVRMLWDRLMETGAFVTPGRAAQKGEQNKE